MNESTKKLLFLLGGGALGFLFMGERAKRRGPGDYVYDMYDGTLLGQIQKSHYGKEYAALVQTPDGKVVEQRSGPGERFKTRKDAESWIRLRAYADADEGMIEDTLDEEEWREDIEERRADWDRKMSSIRRRMED